VTTDRPLACPALIRPLRPADLDGALAANTAIGWDHRRPLFDFYGARDDSALFVAELDGEIVGTAGATLFAGPAPTGWVHGIVVRPERQRTGLGARLTETAIAWLHARSAPAVLLLATDAGRPVYERLGFVAGGRYGLFPWPGTGPEADLTLERMQGQHRSAVHALDRAATGEDRGGFIDALAVGGWVATRGTEVLGFHVACPWGGGPTIARDAPTGLRLLRLASSVQRVTTLGVGIPEANTAAVQYLAGLGINAERYVTRMWLGAPPRWRADMIFGVFNFGVA
jgi:GNAT superfamily N-acetyltransferase